MRHPHIIILLLASLFTCALQGETIELFNGRDLEGWRSVLPSGGEAVGETFSVSKEGHLVISGSPKGYLRTQGMYSGYRLIVEWRWIEKPGNSGVLLHAQGADKVWPLCVEAQLKNNRAGDVVFIGVGAGGTFGDATALVVNPDHPYHAAKRIAAASENEPGEWNRYEILADGALLELRVNGVLQNRATDLTLTAGAICLQSEGATIEFRKIRLEAVN